MRFRPCSAVYYFVTLNQRLNSRGFSFFIYKMGTRLVPPLAWLMGYPDIHKASALVSNEDKVPLLPWWLRWASFLRQTGVGYLRGSCWPFPRGAPGDSPDTPTLPHPSPKTCHRNKKTGDREGPRNFTRKECKRPGLCRKTWEHYDHQSETDH